MVSAADRLLESGLEDSLELAEELGAIAAGRLSAEGFDGVADGALRAGMESLVSGDYLAAADDFQMLFEHPHARLGFLGRLWCARARLGAGRLDEATDLSLELTERADDELTELAARLLTVERCAATGEIGPALDEVGAAEQGLRRLRRGRGAAVAALLQARLLALAGRERDAVDAACRSVALDRSRPGPLLFLARRAIREGQSERATRILAIGRRFVREELLLARELVDCLVQAPLPPGDRHAYTDLGEAPPTAAVLDATEQLVGRWPECVPLRMLLADRTLQVARFDDAEQHFAWLAARSLPPALRRRVRRAQAVLANRAASAARASVVPSVLESGSIPSAAVRARLGESVQPVDLGVPNRVLEGRLEHVPFPHLLGFLSSGRSSGTLLVRSGDELGTVELRDGAITAAFTSECRGLGELLRESGTLDDQGLQLAEHTRRDAPDRRLDDVLVELGLVDAADLEAHLADQAHRAIRVLMTWGRGAFGFTADAAADAAVRPRIALNPEHVLLEAARTLDEASSERS